MPTVRLSQASLRYQTAGSGPPLVCIMGFGAPLEGFALQARHLAANRQVVCFDNRGVGRSSTPPLPWRIADLARDTLDLMDHLGLERADVLGISMGGMIAQRLALMAPHRVNALVLAASFAHADLALQRAMLRLTASSFAHWFRGGLGGRAAFERALRRAWERKVVCEHPLDAESQAILDAGWQMRTEPQATDRGVLGQIWALLGHDARAELHRIRVPTLVLAGSGDALSPLSQARALARGIPGARLEVLAGAPHGMNLASAPLFNAALQAFLEACSPQVRQAG